MDVARDESGGWKGRAQRVLRAENLFGGILWRCTHVHIHSKLWERAPKTYSAASFPVSIIRTYQCILVRVWMSQIHAEKYLKLSDHVLAFHPNQSEQTRVMKTQLSSHCYLSWFCDPAWSPHRSLRTLQVWDEDRELVAFGGNSDMLFVMHHILKLFVLFLRFY